MCCILKVPRLSPGVALIYKQTARLSRFCLVDVLKNVPSVCFPVHLCLYFLCCVFQSEAPSFIRVSRIPVGSWNARNAQESGQSAVA